MPRNSSSRSFPVNLLAQSPRPLKAEGAAPGGLIFYVDSSKAQRSSQDPSRARGVRTEVNMGKRRRGASVGMTVWVVAGLGESRSLAMLVMTTGQVRFLTGRVAIRVRAEILRFARDDTLRE
jgi:hypothetical protein